LWVELHTDSCTASQGERERERERMLTSLVSEAMENLLEDNDEL